MWQRVFRFVWLLSIPLAVVAAVACGDNGSPVSPDAPMGSTSSSGAIIQGQIEGAGGSSATSLRSALDDDAIMVEVVGTGVVDDVDDDGSFRLEGVPGSTSAMLRVSSSTIDTTIRLGAISETDIVTIMLAIVGNDVEVVSATTETDDSMDDDSMDDDDDSMDDDSVDDDSMDDDTNQ